MRGLVALAVRRRVSVIMVALAVIAFGFVGYSRLALELFPNVSYPSLTVRTEFPDTAPQEVENLITRPVEEAVGVLRGLQTIHSVSRPGVSEVTLEFDWNSDMDLLSMDVREKLDRVIFPDEADDPIVLRFDPSLDPIMRVALAGPGDLSAMRLLAERKLKPDIETVRGIASAQIKGGLEEEVRIDVDQERLAALRIPIARVRQVVGVSNINLPGGALRSVDSQFLIRTLNEFSDVEAIGDLIISADGPVVRLRDVATVELGAKEREEITRAGGRECVELSIYKEGDANTVTSARLARARLTDWEEDLPPGHELTVLFDQSTFIRQSVAEVRNAALIGGLLAIGVLFAFLRDARSTLIIATSIPLSVIATFVLMYRMQISLNVMSLGGLTLGIGMLVDNAIVVLESIFRNRKAGLGLAQAAIEGTTEVGAAVAASTLTTVAVFLPIIFVEGIAGQLFRDQALTVTVSLLASLVAAVTLIPMLSSLGDRRRMATGDVVSPAVGERDAWTLGRISAVYDRLLGRALAARAMTLAVAFVLFAVAIVSLRLVGTELIPSLSQGEFFFEVNMPEGTALEATDRVVARMEAEVAHSDDIASYYATVGSRLVAGGVSLNTKAENLGQVNIVLEDRSDPALEQRTADRLRASFAEIPDLDVKFGRPSYFSIKTPVQIDLFGEELDVLRDYSLELVEELSAIDGLSDVRSSLEAGNPELQVVFDRAKLAALDLDLGTLSETLKTRVLGVVPTRFKQGDRQIDVRIRNRESDRKSFDDVRNLVLPGPDGQPIRLLTVADVTVGRGPAEIHRLQQQRAAVVTANIIGRGLGGLEKDIQTALRRVPPPAGVVPEIGGQNREMKVSFASLRFALALAIFLVYLVMAATFESFLHPLIVLFTIPLALVGVVAGLLITGTSISVIVLIGTIMLVGIVVNNAIVLIDAINRLRRAGVDKLEAVITAGHTRLRPILMTTLTTVLALVPMALGWGQGAELRAPLGVTVIAGLLLSTLLTLLVIPAAYMLVPSGVPEVDDGSTTATASTPSPTGVQS